MSRPLAIDLFCGLGGWTEGLLAEGYDVIGFDIIRHVYGDHAYPAQLVIQDVLTLHGSQFKSAALIVASPPCQGYSYRAMPWSRAKALPPPDNTLFESCFRIQREASEAAGHHVPLVVENVRGAQKWVGRARWNFGSFYLWGDVPALMPIVSRTAKVPNFRFDGSGKSFQSEAVKVAGLNWSNYGKPGYKGEGFNTHADRNLRDDIKNSGGSWFNIAHNTTSGKGRNPDGRDPMFQRGFTQTAADRIDGLKHGGGWFHDPNSPGRQGGQKGRKYDVPEHDGVKQPGLSGVRDNGPGDRWFQDGASSHGSQSTARKFASAMIAKIPLPLSRHIAATFHPKGAPS